MMSPRLKCAWWKAFDEKYAELKKSGQGVEESTTRAIDFANNETRMKVEIQLERRTAMFTNLELNFLGRERRDLNFASLDRHTWDSMPPYIREKIAEGRAQALGAEFEEFRVLLRAASVSRKTEPNSINLF